MLGMDDTGISSNKDTADAINFFWVQKEVGKRLSGIATDSDRGGTWVDFLGSLGLQ